jgi:Bacterial PH domain
MELRHSAMPSHEPPEPADPVEVVVEPAPTELIFRVDRRLTMLRIGGFLVFALAAAFEADPVRRAFALIAAAVLAAYGLRDLLAPVRLSADAEGVTVITGYAGHRRLPWGEIDKVRLDERRRLGTRSELLEIDTGDNLYLLSTYDLGVRCWDAARQLRRLASAGELGRLPDGEQEQ